VKQLNSSLHKAQPDFFVSTMSIQQRAGRIYVDYNQNLAARNTIAPYSMRGRDTPAVATPVTWEELGSVRGPDDLRFGPEEVLGRIAEYGDLAQDLLTSDAPLLPDEA
jgi:bifunctional non-homologous end joining protein LigD